MSRHVSAEVLARYQEGDLGARRSASIAAHLSACEQCAQTGSDLTAVSGLLASMGQPVMPPALADRLQLAIARESEARASAHAVSGAQLAAAGPAATGAADGMPDAGLADAPAGAGAGQGGVAGEHDAGARIPGRPDLPERSRRRGITWPRLHWPGLSAPALLRGTAAIAVVVVLAGAGFLLARGVSGPESASSSGSGSSGGKRVAAPASQGAGHRAESGQVPASVTGSARLHYRLHGKIVTTTALASHLNFTKDGLAGQVHRAVASHVGFGTVTTPSATASPANGQAGPMLGGINIGKLNGCLSRVSAGRQVVLTEIARYLGRPATIIVLKSLTANILDVAIVRVACSSSAADYIVRTTVPAS